MWGQVGKGGGEVFTGEFRHALDEKGRLFIPTRFRQSLGVRFILTKGLDGCLFVYSLGDWEEIESKLREMSFANPDARHFSRFFLGGAEEVEADRQGRVLLSQPLRQHARLSKGAVILGVGDRVEIWSDETWAAYLKSDGLEPEQMAKNLSEVGAL